ncbi:hypothetical protein IJG92_03420 [Candidatus Saccharibacteria bacterium]|nr:hypothetical protein [Candidatus Saccharibacteria bacterium]
MPKRKRNFRWVKWLLFLLLIAGAVAVVILVKNNYFDKKDDQNTSQAVETNKTDDKKSEEKTEQKVEQKEEAEPEQKAPQYDGESPNKSETLTGLITYADVKDGELIIRVNIDQFLQSGDCNLTLSKNGVTHYSQSVGIVESVTTSTCDGFKISTSELPSGNLQVEINLDSDGKSGKIEGRVKI